MWYHHQCSKMMIPFKMSGFHADEQAQGHRVRTTRGEKRQQREIDEQPVFRLFCVCHETGLENILLPSCTLWEKKTCETAAEVQLRSSDTGCGKLSLTRDQQEGGGTTSAYDTGGTFSEMLHPATNNSVFTMDTQKNFRGEPPYDLCLETTLQWNTCTS